MSYDNLIPREKKEGKKKKKSLFSTHKKIGNCKFYPIPPKKLSLAK